MVVRLAACWVEQWVALMAVMLAVLRAVGWVGRKADVSVALWADLWEPETAVLRVDYLAVAKVVYLAVLMDSQRVVKMEFWMAVSWAELMVTLMEWNLVALRAESSVLKWVDYLACWKVEHSVDQWAVWSVGV